MRRLRAPRSRYLRDLRDPTTWQLLSSATDRTGYRFTGELAVTRQASAEYDALIALKLDVPWKSDEEAGVRWSSSAHAVFSSG